MSDLLTIFKRLENFESQPDFCEKIGNFGLGLLTPGFGRTVKIQKIPDGCAFIVVHNSTIRKVVGIALFIFLLPIAVLLSGIGIIAATCSNSRKKFLDLYKQNQPIPRADRIARIALSYLPIRDLYEQASKTPGYKDEIGSYKIEFISKTRTGFEASCNPDTRTIQLLHNLSDTKALSYFVFELINAKEYTKHIQNYNKFLLSKNNLEYTKDSERTEFENTIEHYNIVKAADLGSDYVIWGERKPEDFEKVWTDQLATSSHAEYWRSNGKFLGTHTAVQVVV